MLFLTIAKFLTALVSCATAITLLTLIPLLLKWKVRELFLKQNVMELGQEVGMMMKQKEASWHVRMLTREIRKSLDKHTILYTTLVELSQTLDLHNCAVWMPSENRTEMNLTHELKARSSNNFHLSIPINDPDVLKITESKGVCILRPDSALGLASRGGSDDSGAVAAIRMPMLCVSNFKGGTPEFVDTCYTILVLVLPSADSRVWSIEEMEIVEVVADQVAVALSHAAVLEESQLMREKLGEQNRALQQAKENAMMASQARISFQKVMSRGMRRPMYSILGLLSMFHNDNMSFEQKIIVETLVKTSNVLSTLINDVMDISAKDDGRFPIEMRPFRLHSMLKEASCLFRCLSVYKGFGFGLDVQSSLPDQSGSQDKNEKMLVMRRPSVPDSYVYIKFELEIKEVNSQSDGSNSTKLLPGWGQNSNEVKEGLSFNMCKKLVKMMQGNLWISSNPQGFAQRMTLVLRFQIQPSFGRSIITHGNSSEQSNSYPQFKGLRLVLADDDDVNRTVTKRLLEMLGCEVIAVSSGFECLSALTVAENSFRIVVLDLHMPEMDGFEVAMRIRKFRSHMWPLIIALTASAEDNVWERCLQAGMNGLIRKPVLLRGMADELRRVLQQAGERV
ncbi:hypothetical protein Patl1_23204 [Pistacia atlantica]|uniref:Uncharacterized protein n=1 Tax=Pistacia atlantica TaxID=434234 RepID=A0ACC0ZZC7_9ROSI|nr:hypothetical protein Patl1_23204 [Pistacia atlantica]